VAECGGLENRCQVTPDRGFESHALRNPCRFGDESRRRWKVHRLEVIQASRPLKSLGSVPIRIDSNMNDGISVTHIGLRGCAVGR
jgi:hypothetical protein